MLESVRVYARVCVPEHRERGTSTATSRASVLHSL